MRSQPNQALTEILEQTGELDRILDGRGLTFELAAGPPPPSPSPPPRLPPPDWHEEELERHRREAAAGPVREPDPPLVVEDTQTRPAGRTPRLSRSRAWRRTVAEQPAAEDAP